ncbi:hypothetical protein PG990_012974 [Apiospora arundinis]
MRSLSPRSGKQDAGQCPIDEKHAVPSLIVVNSCDETSLKTCAHHGDGTEPTPISAITHRCGHRPAA